MVVRLLLFSCAEASKLVFARRLDVELPTIVHDVHKDGLSCRFQYSSGFTELLFRRASRPFIFGGANSYELAAKAT